jgi:hypothetical protein
MGHSHSSEANSFLATLQIPELYEPIITVFTNDSSPAPVQQIPELYEPIITVFTNSSSPAPALEPHKSSPCLNHFFNIHF